MTAVSNLSRLELPEVLHEVRRDVHNKAVSQPGTRAHVEGLCKLVEYTCRFAVQVRICALRDAAPEGQGVARINALGFLGPLARPTFGQLVSILQRLTPELDAASPAIHPHVREALSPDRPLRGQRLGEVSYALRERSGQRIATLAQLLTVLVQVRNAQLHPHIRPLTEAEAADLAPSLHEGVAELLATTPLLTEWRLLLVSEVVVGRAGLHVKGVAGDRHACPPMALRAGGARPPEPGHLHLAHVDGGGGLDGLVDLFPLMGFDPNDARRPLRVFCEGTRGRPLFEGCDDRDDAQTAAMRRLTVMLGPPQGAIEDHYRDVVRLVSRVGAEEARERLESTRRLIGLTPERAAALEREVARAAAPVAGQLPLPLTRPEPEPPDASAQNASTTASQNASPVEVPPGVARLGEDCAVEVSRPLLAHAALLEPGSWLDAVRGCNARSASDGLALAYDIDALPSARADLRFHEVRLSLAPTLGEGLLAELEARFFFEPGRGGRRKERRDPEAVIAGELVTALRDAPERLLGPDAAARLKAGWSPEPFLAFAVRWRREADGWRLPTEAEWRLLAAQLPDTGPEWVWDLDPDTRERSGIHPGAPPRGTFRDWCGEAGGPRRLWMMAEAGVVARRCALPWDRAKRIGARVVRGA